MTMTLFSLSEGIRRCTSCSLCRTRTLAVPGEGPINSEILFVGEAPGVEEDRLGQPFVGKSGKFLSLMLQEIGISRKDVFMTGSLKCHPPYNRSPRDEELDTCRELWLLKQISLINPKVIVLLGSVALWSLLQEKNLQTLHGTVLERNGQHYFITYHPSAAMRFPKVRELMKKDFTILKNLHNRF